MNSDRLATNEVPKLTPLTKINLLVHPLFKTATSDEFSQPREKLSNQILQNFLPSSESEVTCFMLHLDNSSKKTEIQSNLGRIKENSDYYQWTDLYRDLVTTNLAANPNLNHNLLLSPDLVAIDSYIDPQIFPDFLKEKGFELTPDTKIVIAGEILERCVADTVYKLMANDNITTVYVDRNATLGEYLVDSSENQEAESTDRFLTELGLFHYNAELNDNNVIRISKTDSTILLK